MIDTVALREKVLDLAIRGKLVPQDPNDESASVLLERIRAQKQQMVKDGKLKAKDIKDDSIIFVGEDNLHYEKFADGSVKCIEDEIPFELPEGWAWARIASIAEEVFAGGDKPERFSKERNNECQYAIYSNGVENDGLYGFTDTPRVVKPSITVSGRGTIGFSCVRYAPFFPIIRLITITPSALISLEFLDFVFKRFLETGTGSSIPQLTVPMIKPKLIPIPPIKEQEKIVVTATGFFEQIKLIEKHSSDLFETIASVKSRVLDLATRGKLVPQDPNEEPASVLLDRIRAEKEELIRQGRIKRDKKESIIFKGEDNSYYRNYENKTVCIDENIPFEIPSNWEWCNLSMIGSTNIGLTYKPEDIVETGTMVLRSSNIINGKIDLADLVRVKTSLRDNQYMEENDILICARNGSKALVGKCAIFSGIMERASFGAFMAVYRTSFYKYVYYFLNSNIFRSTFNSDDTKQINQLTQDMIKNALIPFPPIQEQIRIVETIETAFSQLDAIAESLN